MLFLRVIFFSHHKRQNTSIKLPHPFLKHCSMLSMEKLELKLTFLSTNAHAISLRVESVSSPPSTVTDSLTKPICMEKVRIPERPPFSSAMLSSYFGRKLGTITAEISPEIKENSSEKCPTKQMTVSPLMVCVT